MPRADRQIWCEPPPGTNRLELAARCRNSLLKGEQDSFIYLIATRPLLDRAINQIIDGIELSAAGRLPVYLFDGLVGEITGRAQGALRPISEGLKFAITERVVRRLVRDGKLEHLGEIAESPGCVQSVGELISEIKRAGKRPDEFRRFVIENAGTARDFDLAEIYTHYQATLDQAGLVDADDVYLEALRVLEQGLPERFRLVRSLYLDGFFDFTPVQQRLIYQLVSLIPQVIINLPFDERNPSVFYPVSETMRFFEELGFLRVARQSSNATRDRRLEQLALALFNPEAEPLIDLPVMVCSAPDRTHEIRAIAAEIKRLVLEEGYRPGEIALVLRDLSRYAPIIRPTFDEYGIPCAMEWREPLSSVPAIKAALKLVECRVGSELIESYAALLKNDYLDPCCTLEPDAAENALAAVGLSLSRHEWIKRAKRLLEIKRERIERWARERADPEEAAIEAARLERQAAEIKAALLAVDEINLRLGLIPERGCLSEMLESFERALQAFKLEERILEQLRGAGYQLELEAAARDLAALELLRESIRNLAAASDQTIIEVQDLKPILEELLSRTPLLLERGDAGGVSVLDATQARGLCFKLVFIGGLAEGVFPQAPKGDWIYPDEERPKLQEAGLYLEDISPESFEKKEVHFFYHSACMASERLYLYYPRRLNDDEETIPSLFIEELQRISTRDGGPSLEIEHRVKELRAAAVFSAAALPAALYAEFWQTPENEGQLVALYNLALEARLLDPSFFARLAIEEERRGRSFGPFDGKLGDLEILRQLERRFGPARVYSASQFNTYSSCPFRFFCERLLQLRPREEAMLDLQRIDRGYLLHEILRSFLERHLESNLREDKLAEYRSEIAEAAESVFAKYQRSALPLNPYLWEIEKREVLEALFSFLEFEIKYQKEAGARGVAPWRLELGYGMSEREECHGKSQPLVLISGRDRVLVRGRIDRVDRSPDGKYIAYDYKSGWGSSINDIREGADLQIPLYIMALAALFLREGEEVVGGGYYSVQDGSRNRGMYRKDYAEYAAIKASAGSSLERQQWDETLDLARAYIWEYVGGMRRGDYRVAPRSDRCCPRCAYRSVCRYQKQRIAAKLAAHRAPSSSAAGSNQQAPFSREDR